MFVQGIRPNRILRKKVVTVSKQEDDKFDTIMAADAAYKRRQEDALAYRKKHLVSTTRTQLKAQHAYYTEQGMGPEWLETVTAWIDEQRERK